jgi:predicted permease
VQFWRSEIRKLLVELDLDPVIVEELAQHLDDFYQEALASGATPEEAECLTRAELSGSDALRQARSWIEPTTLGANRRSNMIADLWQDLRYGLRQLRLHPGFTAVATLTLALGVGANTAIFSLMDSVLLKLLPVNDPEQLVAVGHVNNTGEQRRGFSYPAYKDLQERNQALSGLIAYSGAKINLSEGGQTERVDGQLVSGNYFSLLGVQPIIGRAFTEADNLTPGAHPVAILSYGFWSRRFADDPSVVGKTVRLNSIPYTVIGVAPAGFYGVEIGVAPAVWVPMMMQPQATGMENRLEWRNNFWVSLMARLKPGVGREQAQAATELTVKQLNTEAPGLSSGLRSHLLNQRIELLPASKGLSALRSQFEKPLLILMGMVGLVLLIACANVANLLLARAAARQQEIAVRLAIGASRFRLARQLLAESLLLSIFGGALGLAAAFWTTDWLVALAAGSHFTLELQPDLRVLGFNFGLAVLTGILFGLAPAFQATRPNLTAALKQESLAAPGLGGRFELRKLLVVAQAALSVLLLIGAGLFVRTLQNLKDVDLGMHADKVLMAAMNPRLNGYTTEQCQSFYSQLLDRVKVLPGVVAASMTDMPLLDGAWIDGVSIKGRPARPGEDMSVAAKNVEPGFFDVMGVPLLAGRDFTAGDGPGAPKVAIVNETFVRNFWGNENPLGRRIVFGGKDSVREIIGVIKDTKYRDVKAPAPRTVYVPFGQTEIRVAERTLHVRTAGEPQTVIAAIRREVQALDQDLPLYNIRTFTDVVAGSMSQERALATLASVFGALALALASIGLYGVLAYDITRRRREIGVRIALGAQSRDVLTLIVGRGLRMTAIGVAIGLAAAYGLTRLLKGLLYGVSATDPLTFAAIPLLLIVVALLAGIIPARRAARIDPMAALRAE